MRIAKQHHWMKHAACSGKGDLFHNEKSRIVTRQAKVVCAGCSVRQECLDYALDNEQIGVWGGLTGNERRRLRRTARRTR